MTTTDKNRIIAQFMGYESNEDIEGEFDESTLYNVDDFLVNTSGKNDWETTENDWTSWVKPSEMQYHSDWNWLCLVIEKIELMSHTGFMGTVQMFGLGRTRINCYQSEILRKEIDIIGERYGINPTHEAVFQFIIWYNQQQKL